MFLQAADKAPQVTVLSTDRVVSHIALGGGWTTTLTVVNLWSAPSPFQISFYDDSGLPLSVNTNSAQGVTPVYRSTVAVKASQRILISGDSTVKSGWAEVSYDWATAVVGVSAVFRQSIDGRPDFEAVSPVTTPYSAIRVPFDETGGVQHGSGDRQSGDLGRDVQANGPRRAGELLERRAHHDHAPIERPYGVRAGGECRPEALRAEPEGSD
jgi:hypothetical protein